MVIPDLIEERTAAGFSMGSCGCSCMSMYVSSQGGGRGPSLRASPMLRGPDQNSFFSPFLLLSRSPVGMLFSFMAKRKPAAGIYNWWFRMSLVALVCIPSRLK